MPLSKSHHDSLERHLKAHAKDVTDLREARDALTDRAERRAAGYWDDPNPKPSSIAVLHEQSDLLDLEIDRHEQLIALARDERVLQALGELVDHPELVTSAARDPHGYARARGIDLPATMDVVVRLVDGHPMVRVTNDDDLAPFSLIWDSEGVRLPA
jgi:hypothetical protein